jgi:hypothetical protein
MTIKVDSSQTIYDICLIAYGDASMTYKLIAENPTLITSVLSNLTGLTLNYTPLAYSYTQKEASLTVVESQKNVTIQSTQTLFDVALQYYGSAEKVYQLIAENPTIIGILDTDYTNKTLNYTENKTKVPSFFKNNEIIVSTRKEITIPVIPSYFFLLKEDGFYLLKEDGFKIILE